MKVLLDHNITLHVRKLLPGHEVHTAREMRWDELKNGLLLQAAEEQNFDVLITADQNIYYQQNNSKRAIALVVLSTNDWTRLAKHIDLIAAAILRSKRGSFELVRLPAKRGRN